MDDEAILNLYRLRQAAALTETEAKYGRLCFCVADRILNSREDSEECVNDTWLHAWNAIPPEKPKLFPAWLSRVTRNLTRLTLCWMSLQSASPEAPIRRESWKPMNSRRR